MSARLLAVMLLAILCVANAHCKSGRNFYTDERLAWMRENLAKYEWAQQERDKIIARAERWAAYDDERLQHLVPPLEVARCGTVHNSGCPVHGEAILKYPGRKKSWKMSFDEPYKIQCPVDGESYPSNDFWAYLQGGCKDKSLLTGEYVDDGWGCEVPGHEKKFWFVGFYAGEMTRRWLLPAIRDMSQAYLLTGERKYAHKTALLVWKLAQYYPDYAYEKQSRYGLEFMSWYLGRLQYHTWECFTIQDVTLAYDAIYPAIEGDAELEQFTGQSAEQIRRDIEDRILRVAANDITDGSHRIQGNYGMHQSALLRIALVLDTDEGEPTSAEMVEWVMKGPEKVTLYTDTPLPDAMLNLFHRDGVPFESPSYNCGWMTELEDVAELLLLNGVNIWEEPRFRGLYTWPLKMLICGTMTQPMGDSNNMFGGGLGVTPTYLEGAYRRMRDPRQAQVMVQRDRPFRHRLFEENLEDEIRVAAERYGRRVGVTSELLPGLGYATLQTGPEENPTALALYYGYYQGHTHYDRLNLEVYAHNHPLIPDLGYPETADTFDPRRHGWLDHTVVHNTVMVDATKQRVGFGDPVAYHRAGWAQMIEAAADSAYPDKVSDYRRACFLIEVDDTAAYCVDFFRVAGGQQHDWIIHGTQAEFSVEGLQLSEPRALGTLAGPDVPYGQFYDDPNLIEGKPGTRYHTYQGSGFQWLINVQEAPLDGVGGVTWRLNRDPELYPYKPTEGIGLRVHLLGDRETVFVCDGIPQRRRNFPEMLKWVIRRREGEELASTFATVFEPFGGGEAFITEVTRLPVTPDDASAALRVSFDGGGHVVFWTPHPEVGHTFGDYTVTGRAACVRLDGSGSAVAARLFDGTALRGPGVMLTSAGPAAAKIAELDYQQNLVRLDAEVLDQTMVGRWVRVDTGGHVTAVRIDEVTDARTFSLGDQDLRCGVASALEVDEQGVVKHDRVMYFVNGGMTVLDEAGEVVDKLGAVERTSFALAEKKPSIEEFPDADGDGRRRFRIVAIGTGDAVIIPAATDLSQ